MGVAYMAVKHMSAEYLSLFLLYMLCNDKNVELLLMLDQNQLSVINKCNMICVCMFCKSAIVAYNINNDDKNKRGIGNKCLCIRQQQHC